MPATVLQLSDVHLAAVPGGPVHGIDPDARLRIVLDAWAASGRRADLLLVTGDDAEDGSAEAYERLADALAGTDLPVLIIPGNHDEREPLAARFGSASDAEVGGWRVVGVDSVLRAQIHGAVDAEAVAARLDAVDDRPTVLAIHHPPRSPSTHPWFRLEGADDLLEVLAARPHVRAVVSGHLHQPFDLAGPGGLRLLGAPSTFEPIDHDGGTYTAPGTCAAGARILHLGDDGVLDTELLVA